MISFLTFSEDLCDIFFYIKLVHLLYMIGVTVFIIINVLFDVNYVVRTVVTTLIARLDKKYTLRDVTSIYGMGTFQDCDVSFQTVREARLLRELDFARYHYYERTDIMNYNINPDILCLQAATFTVIEEPVPIFWLYKINTKMVYWDDKSLYFEHELVTLHDDKVRCLFVSRQHVMSEVYDENETSVEKFLKGVEGSQIKYICPLYIKHWSQGVLATSRKLRSSNNKLCSSNQ